VGDWFFVNARWIIPVGFLVAIFPYGFASMLAVEFAWKRAVFLNRHFVIARALFRPNTSTAGRIRAQRKDLALRIQDLFEELIVPAIPEWREDPIINRETIVDRRRASDRKRAKQVQIEIKALVGGDLEANNPQFLPGSPKNARPSVTVLEVRAAMKGLDETIVENMLGEVQNHDDNRDGS
jgi:hypothetical protein